jgi:hypothetical protein
VKRGENWGVQFQNGSKARVGPMKPILMTIEDENSHIGLSSIPIHFGDLAEVD